MVLDLRTASGNIRALFLDISVNYGLLSTLDDHGPTLVDANRGTTLEGFSVGEWLWGRGGGLGGVYSFHA